MGHLSKMSRLFDVLIGYDPAPSKVTVEGAEYTIITDFRFWMSVESKLLNADVAQEERMVFLLSAFMPSTAEGLISRAGYPFSLDAGIDALLAFYLCGKAEVSGKGAKANPAKGKVERGYDFVHDISLIHAAFRSAYQIDLSEVDTIHWWKFRALFNGLPEGTAIRSLMQARTQVIEKPTDAQKRAKAEIALPENIRYFTPGQAKPQSVDEWAEQIRKRREQAEKRG